MDLFSDQLEMVNHSRQQCEIRAYCDEISVMKSRLEGCGAQFLHRYAFTDYIYSLMKGKFDYDREFVRIRQYHETHWDQKNVEVVHKIKGGKSTKPDFPKHQFDLLIEAQNFLRGNYRVDLSFHRQGWEYQLKDVRVFSEEIDYLPPTMEVIASSKEEIFELFEKLQINQHIHHSVPELVKESHLCVNQRNV